MATKGSTFFRATALASALVVAGTSIALGEGDEAAPVEPTETVEVTPEFTSAVACVAPSEVLTVDARTQASDAYRLSIDPSGITAETFAGLSNDELGFVRDDVLAQVEDNFQLAAGEIADRLFHPSQTGIRSTAAGTGFSGEGVDMFNPENTKRNIGAFAETLQTFAAGIDRAEVFADADSIAAARDSLTTRLEATKARVLSQVGAAFDGITEAREAEVAALPAEGGEVTFCDTGVEEMFEATR